MRWTILVDMLERLTFKNASNALLVEINKADVIETQQGWRFT